MTRHAAEMDVPVLDSSGDGEPVVWSVFSVQDAGVRQVEAVEAVVLGGALVFRDGDGALVCSWGPGTWGTVERVEGTA